MDDKTFGLLLTYRLIGNCAYIFEIIHCAFRRWIKYIKFSTKCTLFLQLRSENVYRIRHKKPCDRTKQKLRVSPEQFQTWIVWKLQISYVVFIPYFCSLCMTRSLIYSKNIFWIEVHFFLFTSIAYRLESTRICLYPDNKDLTKINIAEACITPSANYANDGWLPCN